MIKIRKAGIVDRGELITSYTGYNRKILNSADELTNQNVHFKETFLINGGELKYLCFEFKLLNRTFLMVLDQEKLYEVYREGDDKVYIRLTESWFYILRSFVQDNRIVYKITLTLHYEYSPEAEYHENFKLQFSMKNDVDVIKMFEKMRSREEEDM
jgi:hypothetical protein